MKTTYTIYRPDGARETVETDMPKYPGYAELVKIIEPLVGGMLERVNVLNPAGPGYSYTDMFVNENGHAEGLAFNKEATRIYRANWLKQKPETDADSLPHIVGVAVLFGRRVWN